MKKELEHSHRMHMPCTHSRSLAPHAQAGARPDIIIYDAMMAAALKESIEEGERDEEGMQGAGPSIPFSSVIMEHGPVDYKPTHAHECYFAHRYGIDCMFSHTRYKELLGLRIVTNALLRGTANSWLPKGRCFSRTWLRIG